MDATNKEDWSELCEELIGEIAKQLSSIEDFVRFGSVCRSWHSVTVQKHYSAGGSTSSSSSSGGGGGLPWLMLRERDNKDDDTRDFFSLSKDKMYHLNLPEAHGRRCWGSPYGWLVTMGLDLDIHLLNPLTRVQIHLPPQSTFQDQYDSYREPEYLGQYFVDKVVIAPPSTTSSSSSSADRFLAMAIYSQDGKLAIARPGDKGWTTLDGPLRPFYVDIVCFNGQFFAVTGKGDVHLCDISDPHSPKVAFFASQPEDVLAPERFYLLNMAGDLHMVVRMYDLEGEATLNGPPGTKVILTHFFEVYKLDLLTKKWTELMSFDGYALFVGDNTSFSVATAKHPEECKGNCIYFTEDSYEGQPHDFGRDTAMKGILSLLF